jgi:hypothetical protein
MHVGVRCSLDGPADTVERACFRCHSGSNQPLTSVSPPLGRPTCVPEAFLTRYGAICPGSQFRTASAALASGESQAWLLTATVSSTLATAALSASICTQRCFLPSHCSAPGRLFIPPIHRDSDKLFGGRMQRNATLGLWPQASRSALNLDWNRSKSLLQEAHDYWRASTSVDYSPAGQLYLTGRSETRACVPQLGTRLVPNTSGYSNVLSFGIHARSWSMLGMLEATKY